MSFLQEPGFDLALGGKSKRAPLHRSGAHPTLHPGDIVIMDNLGSHRSSAVRRALRAVGAKLFFLPK
jgi:transposase